MRLTLSTLACPDWTLSQIIDAAVANGIAGIDFRGIGAEIDITQLPAFNTDWPATLHALQKHHLQMPCLNTSVTLLTAASAKWEAMTAEANRYAQLASRSGTKFIRIFGGSIPVEMTRDEALELARQHLREIVSLCRPRGCKPLLETHDAWVLSPQLLQMLDGFDSTEAGVLWDLEHPWRGGEAPAQTASQLDKRIAHIHIKDTVRQDGKSVPKLLGEGELPLDQCKNALASIGYDGWICLETEKRWQPEGPAPETSVPQFAKYMRREWKVPGYGNPNDQIPKSQTNPNDQDPSLK